MKNVLLLIFISLIASSCGQDYNSNYGDYGQYAPIEGLDSSTPDGVRLLATYKIMQGKCFSCHASFAPLKSSNDWVSSGRVMAGNASASNLYTILSNNGGNMPPPNATQLTDAEVAIFETWMNGIP